jgi:RNA polymerase sigma factor (sigma-70 family)
VSYTGRARDTHWVHGVPMERDELEVELAREHPDAFAWALRCSFGAHQDAEDALHAAYERILDGRARFDGRSTFRTWLFGVVRRTALEERRRGWLRLERLRRWFDRTAPADDGPGDPGGPLEERETADALQDALRQLSRRQQEIIHLVFYQEMSVQEAAAVLGMPVGTARTHYERGKARLRRLLARGGFR